MYQTLMTASDNMEILLLVTVKIDGITCCAPIDNSAGSSYVSAQLLDLLKKRPCETKTRRLDMLINSKVTKLKVYDTVVDSLDGNFQISVKLTRANKGEPLSIVNPKYRQLIDKYPQCVSVFRVFNFLTSFY